MEYVRPMDESCGFHALEGGHPDDGQDGICTAQTKKIAVVWLLQEGRADSRRHPGA